nr:hypothetical protein [Tanacetum cinerariifolium]
RVVKFFNCQGEGHMARQCPKPKRKRDATWFRDKVLLVEAQGSVKVLNEEELEFLANPRVAEGPVTQIVITHNAAYQADNLDAHDSDCNDFSTTKAVQFTTYPSKPHAITYSSTPLPNAYSSIVHQDACPQPQSIPQIKYTVCTVNQQTHLAKFPQTDSGLAVHVFKQGDDPIDAINKMISFLSTVVSSRFLTTNNLLRNSSNPRQHVTIYDGRVTAQPVLGRQSSFTVGTFGTRA